MSSRDWWEWHRSYDDPGSPLSHRLVTVQTHLRRALDRCRQGPIQVISMCAGQGRDLIPVLGEHPRRDDVDARLVELDSRNVEAAKQSAAQLAVRVEVVQADAGWTDAYVDAVPAQIVLACGLFGNISEDDIQRTVLSLPTLCASGATVIWTRHRHPPDLTPVIRSWFSTAGFVEEAFETPGDTIPAVGMARLDTAPLAFEEGRRMFTFIGHEGLARREQQSGC